MQEAQPAISTLVGPLRKSSKRNRIDLALYRFFASLAVQTQLRPHVILSAGFFALFFLALMSRFSSPAFASFCQVSNISYNYPQEVSSGQSFTATVTVSGVCAADDADYYSIRSDLTSMSGLVLSSAYSSIGFSQDQQWTVSVQNQVTAPTNSGAWQIRFVVYIFADIGGGDRMDSVTFKPATIQIGT